MTVKDKLKDTCRARLKGKINPHPSEEIENLYA